MIEKRGAGVFGKSFKQSLKPGFLRVLDPIVSPSPIVSHVSRATRVRTGSLSERGLSFARINKEPCEDAPH